MPKKRFRSRFLFATKVAILSPLHELQEMLNPEDVERALTLQTKTFGLLQWVGDAVRQGTLTFSTAHQYASASDSLRHWLSTYSRQIPGKWRPKMSDPEELEQFINLFTSYLSTSFELIEEPSPRPVSLSDGCMCDLCRQIVAVAASHIKARKLSYHDKQRALVLKLEYLRDLASSTGSIVSDDHLESLIEGKATAEAVALAAYGAALVRRCHGDPGGPAVLALWRQFAWNHFGSPRRDFVLTADLILESERILAGRLAV